MGKVINTTNVVDSSYLLSQTPPNYSKDNYWLNELQEKVNADWEFRPNRVDIEEEQGFGTEEYKPIEVVIQSVRDDKGTKVSDDWRRIVFKDIFSHREIGTRYRFSYAFDLQEPNINKSIWIAVNQDSSSPTAQQVIARCNGTIGSIWVDENGNKIYHYEPVVQGTTLSSTPPSFSEVAVDLKSQLIITCQHNKYTKDYYINQRFVIGYDRVYKISNIVKTDALRTYQPDFVGVMTLYLDFDQSSAKDDFENRIAYNGTDGEINIPQETPVPQPSSYEIKFVSPVPLPAILYGDSDSVPYEVWLYKDGEKTSELVSVRVYLLDGDNKIDDPQQIAKYCEFDDVLLETEHIFTLKRVMQSWGKRILVQCYSIPEGAAPGTEISYEFELSLWGLE